MPRPQSVSEPEVLNRLAAVFARHGYEGASLGLLAEAAGLGKATLYHRFPDGKQQMAQEVLESVGAVFADGVIAPMLAEGPPAQRIAAAVDAMAAFYQGGRRACLLNMLAVPAEAGSPLTPAIATMIRTLLDAFARLCRDAGFDKAEAERRATRALMLLQGGLVLARGLGSVDPFTLALAELPRELTGRAPDGGTR